MGKGIFAREAKMVQAAMKFSNQKDIALLTDEKSPRGLWPLARIISIKTNQQDCLMTSVRFETKSSTLERPIDKMFLLEGEAEVTEEA